MPSRKTCVCPSWVVTESSVLQLNHSRNYHEYQRCLQRMSLCESSFQAAGFGLPSFVPSRRACDHTFDIQAGAALSQTCAPHAVRASIFFQNRMHWTHHPQEKYFHFMKSVINCGRPLIKSEICRNISTVHSCLWAYNEWNGNGCLEGSTYLDCMLWRVLL